VPGANLDFGSRLSTTTSLVGLGAASGISATLDPKDIEFDVTFGAILVPDINAVAPGGSQVDRFFLKVRSGANEHELLADIDVSTDVKLLGRLGFLGVALEGKASANTANPNAAFAITRANPEQPMIALDIAAPGITVGSGTGSFTISDAVRLGDLISTTKALGLVNAVCNIRMNGGLHASATTGEPAIELAGGDFALNWPSAFGPNCTPQPSTLQVTPSAEFNSRFKVFDIDPANPQAMLGLILDGLGDFALGAEKVSGDGLRGALDAQLPLVNLSPRDLIGQLKDLRLALDKLREAPPQTLQELEARLTQELGLPRTALRLQISDLPAPSQTTGDGISDLVIRLGYGQCTAGNTTLPACGTGIKTVAKPQPKLNLALDGLSNLVGLDGNASLEVEHSSNAQLDLAIPLKPGINRNSVVVVDTSKIELTVAISASALNLMANIGPLALQLGTAVDTDPNQPGMQSGAGLARLGAAFKLVRSGLDSTDNNEVFTVDNYVTNLRADLTGAGERNCGNIDPDGAGPQPAIALVGDGCARLALGGTAVGTSQYFGDVGFVAVKIDDPSTWRAPPPPNLNIKIDTSSLDWALLLKGLDSALAQMEASLDGKRSGVKVPLIGDALDAGSDFAGTIRRNLTTPLNTLATKLQTETNPVKIQEIIQREVFEAIKASLLRDRPGSPAGVELNDVVVTLICKGSRTCTATDSATIIEDVRISLVLGQGLGTAGAPVLGCDANCVDGKSVPFNIGLSGLPVRSEGALNTKAGWAVITDFGLSRKDGPYFMVGGEGHTQPEVQLGASVGLGEAPNACAQDILDPAQPDGLRNFSADRCLFGLLGFLQTTLRDGDGADQTRLRALFSVDLNSPNNRLTYAQLVAGNVDIKPKFEGDAQVNLRFRAGLTGVGKEGPSVLGRFQMKWALADGKPSEIKFNTMYLDAGKFASGFMGDVVKDIKKVTSPIQTVIDTIRAPIPVLSDVSRSVGGGDISLLSLVDAAADDTDLSLFRRMIGVINLINELPADKKNFFIPLGSSDPQQAVADTPGVFEVDVAQAQAGPLTPDRAGDLVKNATRSGGVIGALGLKLPEGFSMPFLSDSLNLFKLMMGQDVTLVHFDAGTLRAEASIYASFPLPIPVIQVTFGGAVELRGHFAMGYDTSGLRKVLSGAPAGRLVDGLYLDDLDANGVDVDEIALKGSIRAGAKIDIVIAGVGAEGGIELTVGLNLNDGPVQDGKLHFAEIATKLNNPFCLFDITGKLTAFLEAWARVGVWIFSKTWRWRLAEITLLEFSSSCAGEQPQPNLADRDDTDKDALRLHMGIELFRKKRGLAVDDINEKFIVRQLSATLPSAFSVAAFGLLQEKCCYMRIVADGDDGDDEISLEPGATGPADATQVIAFTAPTRITGGTGNDHIRGGDGSDTLSGGDGNDQLVGRGGDDTLAGEGGEDQLNGDLGNDTITGGTDNDLIQGGAGADTLKGEGGDDDISGGPGGSANADVAYQDLGDVIEGGMGSDQLDGNDGDDFVYGDEVLTCDAEGVQEAPAPEPNAPTASQRGRRVLFIPLVHGGSGALASPNSTRQMLAAGSDQLFGGPGNDQLFGGAGDDAAIGDLGNDLVCGNSGNDILLGDIEPATADGGDDVVRGGSGDDELRGEAGHDHIAGESGNDRAWGGDGPDDLFGGDGRDWLSGEAGKDVVLGDIGDIAAHAPADHNRAITELLALITRGDAPAVGTTNCDAIGPEPGNADCLYGGPDDDLLFGEGGHDQIFGESGSDYIEGNAGEDVARGGAANDLIFGNDGNDTLFGDSDADRLFGNAGNDVMRGGTGDDYLEGNQGADTMHGDADQDDLVGGSSVAGTDDNEVSVSEGPGIGDTTYGDAGFDVIAGDNAQIVRPGGINSFDGSIIRAITLFDINVPNPALSGNDVLEGGTENDRLFGQGENDLIRGGGGDDYAEGNAGDDTVYGDAGQDDLIGGSNALGRLDGSDTIWGGNGAADSANDYDVMLGDNGLIVRPLSNGKWQVNTFNAAIKREVTLHDILVVGQPVNTGVFGNDVLNGEASDDILYGQSGDDTIRGGSGQDYLEGNAGNDRLYGDAGDDDLMGGSSAENLQDGEDAIWGDDGANLVSSGHDVIAGDNARVVRPQVFGAWQINVFDGSAKRQVTLFDEVLIGQAILPGMFGGDSLYGEGGNDRIYGQGGADTARGGAGDDYIEGNHDADTLYGDAGQDDVIGGTAAPDRLDSNDAIFGGDGATAFSGDMDVLVGDNAAIARLLACGRWQQHAYNNSIYREVTLFDVASVPRLAASAAAPRQPEIPAPRPGIAFGQDTIQGESGDDVIYGQGGNDVLGGDAGDDYIEGNADDDTLRGGVGNDDLVGGTGRINRDSDTGVYGRLDGRDTLYGDDGFDVLAGDNAILARTLVGLEPPPSCPPPNYVEPPLILAGHWVTNTFNNGIQHEPRILLDVDSPSQPVVSGDDSMFGGADDDLLYGQGGDDIINGGAGDDFAEGNSGADAIGGDEGHDDLIGGSAEAAKFDDVPDTIHGGPGADVIAGDNARITRPLNYEGKWYVEGDDNQPQRKVRLYGFQPDGQYVDPRWSCYDFLYSEDGDDQIYGQGGDDTIQGGAGSDYVEGNEGSDQINGGSDLDYLIGGSSAGDGKIGGGKSPHELADGKNTIDGGGQQDVIVQSNGAIAGHP
jgi:Ca2+-binding RTX toxin-like protein